MRHYTSTIALKISPFCAGKIKIKKVIAGFPKGDGVRKVKISGSTKVCDLQGTLPRMRIRHGG